MTLHEQLNKIKANKPNFSNFKLDVGTAIDAPHSAHWLLNDNDVFVIGIEPNPTNAAILKTGSHKKPAFNHLRLNDSSILNGETVVKRFKSDKFALLEQCAVDDVEGVAVQDFYCTDERNTGCSSLLKPTQALGLDVEKVVKVEVASLEYILDYVGFPTDGHVMFVKTDTQGKDFQVVRSLGKYLKNVVGLKCEYNTKQQYETENDPNDFCQMMLSNGFALVKHTDYDFFFLNKKFAPTVLFSLPEV